MRVLITGIAGFIGSRVAEAMLHHGHEVVGIDNLLTGRAQNVPDGAVWVNADIRDTLPEGPFDVIYHAAASYHEKTAWLRDMETNGVGTINVVRLAQETGARIVYFQTSLCYGPNPISPVKVGAPLNPVGSYAVSKTAGEAYIRESGLPYVSLRLANMYGPRNLSGPVPTFWKRIKEGQSCTIADSRRDFVFVDDLVWVAAKAATQGQGVYHVASGRDMSVMAVFQAVRSAMGGRDADYREVPRGADDVATILLDPSRTEAEFGWLAQTSLEDGIARAVRWYEANGVERTFTHLAQK